MIFPFIHNKCVVDEHAMPPLSLNLATSLLSGTSTTDLSHLLALPSVSLYEVGETLFHSLVLVENGQDRGTLIWRALGLILETYKYGSFSTSFCLLSSLSPERARSELIPEQSAIY